MSTFSKVISTAVVGVNAYTVEVEVDVAGGSPSFALVGLPSAAVKEARDRTQAAINNSGYFYPFGRITINLAPADIRKEGSALDLPIALGILASQAIVDVDNLADYVCLGELALDGHLNPIKGTLCATAHLMTTKQKRIIVPVDNAREAAVVEGVDVYGVHNLKEAVDLINGQSDLKPIKLNIDEVFYESSIYHIDLRDVKGQEHVKRALEVGAAGGHNVLLIGPPGSGKTMLAKRLCTIMPPLAFEEAIETTKIHSVAGLLSHNQALVGRRPFRSPHHTISDAGLIGGGSIPMPGEVSLAHNGILFLDELPEFKRSALEVMRQPLEDGEVTIARAAMSLTYPARYTLVAAMNPTPSGFFPDDPRNTSTPVEMQRYLSKISGPLLDRIDLHIEVPSINYDEMTGQRTGEYSEAIRQRVIKARKIQQERFKGLKIHCNAHMNSKMLSKYCLLDDACNRLMKTAIERLNLSARSYDRILKVSRSIADLDGIENLRPEHISEAIQYRTLDRKLW